MSFPIRSLDVLPRTPRDDFVDAAEGNIKSFRQKYVRCNNRCFGVDTADFSHVCFCQLGVGTLTSSKSGWWDHTATFDCFTYVVSLSTEMKMRRVAASWVVAVMKYVQTVRNRTVRQFPRNTVRSQKMAFAPTRTDVPVPTFSGVVPRPAVVRTSALYMSPEPHDQRRSRSSHCYLPRGRISVFEGAYK